MEYLEICMDKKSYNLFYERYKKNPFIKICFRYLVPYLFKVEKEEVVEKNEIKSGLQALIERNKKRSEKLEKENNSFEKNVINFLYKLEQDYSLVDKITYSYLLNISENLKQIQEEDKKKRDSNKATTTKPMESVAKKL